MNRTTKLLSAITITLGILTLSNVTYAQNVGINKAGTTPDPSSILDLNSGNAFGVGTSKGLLIPNVALQGVHDGTTILNPATSLLVYNTNSSWGPIGYYYNSGLPGSPTWTQIGSGGGSYVKDSAWTLWGNTGTTAGTNFIGTADANDLVFKTNGAENMRILNTNGKVGIATPAPKSGLDVNGNEAIGSYAGTTAAPTNGFIVSGQTGIGTPTPKNTLDVSGSQAVGSYAGNNIAPANGLIVSGQTGIGTPTPKSTLDVSGSQAVGSYAGNNAAPANGFIVSGQTGIGTPTPKSTLDVSGGQAVGSYAGNNAAPANGLIVSGQVGMGTNSPNSSSALDVESTTSGFILPRMTTAEMSSIASPAIGLQVFNTTTNCLMIYTTVGGWQAIWCACNGAPATPTISGPSGVCLSSTGSYSVTALQGTTYYSWTVPSGATITSGQGTNSINVTFGTTSGNVTCTAITSCGNSAAGTLAVTVSSNPTGSITFNYTGAVQTWAVPSCITTVTVTVVGASGGHDYFYPSVPLPGIVDSGGEGGSCSGILTVTGGSTLDIYVGGLGIYGYSVGGAGGFNGGGNGNSVPNGGSGYWASGGGGGASDIRVSPYALANRVAVAGGGGGAGAECSTFDDGQGGAGGASTGGAGYYCGTLGTSGNEPGLGGTQTAGGASFYGTFPGWGYMNGTIGVGGEGYTGWPGGGGGGGYYGGGGGYRSGGGGGSNYVGAFSTVITNAAGTQWGNGYVIIQY